MGSGNTIKDFNPGDEVVYIPTHLQECENVFKIPIENGKAEAGIVKRVSETTVFVRYLKNGLYQETAQGTDANDLWHN